MSRCLHIDDFHRNLTQAMPRLRERAMDKTGCDERADDLVQDTLVKALTLGRSPAGCDFITWLYSMMEYCLSYHEEADAYRPDEQHSETNEVFKDGHAALQRLQPELRSILQLALTGLQYKDIAAIEGIPIGTVMSRLFRARAELKAIASSNRPIFSESPRAKRRAERHVRTPQREPATTDISSSKAGHERTSHLTPSKNRQDHRMGGDIKWGDTPDWFVKLVARTSPCVETPEVSPIKMAPPMLSAASSDRRVTSRGGITAGPRSASQPTTGMDLLLPN